MSTDATSASRSSHVHGLRGARVRSAPSVAARLHCLGEIEAALQRAGEQRRELAHRAQLDTTAAERQAQVACIALEQRHETGRKPDGDGRPARPAGRREQAVVIEEQRVDGERQADGDEPQGLEEPVRELFGGHVEPAEHRDRRPRPDRMRSDHLDERREQEHRQPGDQRSDQIGPAPARRCAERDDEQHRRDQRHRPDVRREQRRDRERSEQRSCRRRVNSGTSERAGRGRAARRPPCRARAARRSGTA